MVKCCWRSSNSSSASHPLYWDHQSSHQKQEWNLCHIHGKYEISWYTCPIFQGTCCRRDSPSIAYWWHLVRSEYCNCYPKRASASTDFTRTIYCFKQLCRPGRKFIDHQILWRYIFSSTCNSHKCETFFKYALLRNVFPSHTHTLGTTLAVISIFRGWHMQPSPACHKCSYQVTTYIVCNKLNELLRIFIQWNFCSLCYMCTLFRLLDSFI